MTSLYGVYPPGKNYFRSWPPQPHTHRHTYTHPHSTYIHTHTVHIHACIHMHTHACIHMHTPILAHSGAGGTWRLSPWEQGEDRSAVHAPGFFSSTLPKRWCREQRLSRGQCGKCPLGQPGGLGLGGKSQKARSHREAAPKSADKPLDSWDAHRARVLPEEARGAEINATVQHWALSGV